MGRLGQVTIDDAKRELEAEFGPNNYNIITRNCNSFSNAFCMALLNKPIPAWVNRLAYMGSWFSCLLPQQMLGDAPVNATGNAANYNTAAARPAAFAGQGVSLGSSSSSSNGNSEATAPLLSATDGLTRQRNARIAALEKQAAQQQQQQQQKS
jgi:PPPDE putative peptidase domain